MPARITDLPAELVREIAQRSGINSVGRLRRTCSRWNEALRTDLFWAELVRRDFPWHLPADGSAPEKPREAYMDHFARRWNDVDFLITRASDRVHRSETLEDLTQSLAGHADRNFIAAFATCVGCSRYPWRWVFVRSDNPPYGVDPVVPYDGGNTDKVNAFADLLVRLIVTHAGKIFKKKEIAGTEPRCMRIEFDDGFEVGIADHKSQYSEWKGEDFFVSGVEEANFWGLPTSVRYDSLYGCFTVIHAGGSLRRH